MFQFSRHSDFAEWYFGKAGFYQTLQVPDLKKGKCFGDSEDYNYIIIADIAITKMENACGTKKVHDFNRWERLLKIYSTIKDFTAGTGESGGGKYFEKDNRMRLLGIWHISQQTGSSDGYAY